MRTTICRVQLLLGVLSLVAFLTTGLFLLQKAQTPHAHEGIRMMYRASHLYIMFVALLNLLLGVIPPLKKTLSVEGLSRITIGLMAPLLVIAFFVEPAGYAIERPITFWAIVGVFGGTLLFVVARVGPSMLKAFASNRT